MTGPLSPLRFKFKSYLVRETSPTTMFKCTPCSPATPLREVPLLGFLEHLPSSDMIVSVYLVTCLPSAPSTSMIVKAKTEGTCFHLCIHSEPPVGRGAGIWHLKALNKCLSNESMDLLCDLEQVNSLGFRFSINEPKGKEAGYIKGLSWF